MNVTVADCLKLPTLREAQLIAGAKGTDRAVSSVSVLEWPETNLLSDELIVGNELVISALVTIKDDVSRQCSVCGICAVWARQDLFCFTLGSLFLRSTMH